MGTSKRLSTPSGDKWRPLKTKITNHLKGGTQINPVQIAGGTVAASNGFSMGSGDEDSHGGGGGKGIRRGGSAVKGISRAIQGAAGFAASFQTGGLDSALDFLQLQDLKGKPAPEVIAKIAERLSDNTFGIDNEVLSDSIRSTLLEVAELTSQTGYEDLEAGLQSFLDSEGIEGLIEQILGRFAFDSIWIKNEAHIQDKSRDESAIESMYAALLNACKSEVHTFITEMKVAKKFEGIDWFGKDGTNLARQIAKDLESRFIALAQTD